MLGHNISWNWGRSQFETFMHRLDDGRDWADKALQADDRDTAVKWWQKMFGSEYFPADVLDAAKALAGMAMPGSAYVSGTGRISATPTSSGPSTRARPTTFHGQEA
jgi:hypothetical protein